MSTTRSITDFETKDVLVQSALAALAISFIAAIGMLEEFNNRILITSLLSLGYLAIGWVPILFGYRASTEVVIEGVDPPVKGPRDLFVGGTVGVIAGVVVSAFAWLASSVDLTGIFIHTGPGMQSVLTFGQGIGFGSLLMIIFCTVLGIFGASLHVMSPTLRSIIGVALGTTIVIAIFEADVKELFKGFRVRGATSLLYTPTGGLTIVSAAAIAALVTTIKVYGKGHGPNAVYERVKQHHTNQSPEIRRRNSWLWGAAGVAAYLVTPQILGKSLSETAVTVGLFLVLGLGLNIVVGQAGMLDLGYVAFFAVGAYGIAMLTSPFRPAQWIPQLDFWVALPIVVIVAAFVGILVGTPVIRMRGDYLAIVTLGFGEIIQKLFLSDWWKPVVGGAQGITNVPSVSIGPVEFAGANSKMVFYLVAVLVAGVFVLSHRLQYSRVGRSWAALREDEQIAEAMGINTVTSKLLAFSIGAVIAALGGALFAAKVGSVFPSSFKLLVSLVILVVIIVGGLGSLRGIAVGAVVLIGLLGGPTLPGLLREFGRFKLLIYGIILIYMMLKRPEGLLPSVTRSRELHHSEMTQDAWLDKAGDFEEEEGVTT
ncbi:Branched-chain amino acid transport system permease protein LivM (TC 3.A.1.4.1) [hydrothermal vent metagenome]|uniref:Branched-chain amino acid transport system permease protein LivM (TC 3.A.1.4.1) n=1 Tax=hydrothermal vent metagenome TaxID=652676 RepID=A0A3B0SR31_9ZZZZ